MKRAFLVLGPESSGTRFLTEILVKAGCKGDYTHFQRWDCTTPKDDLIVWRRSIPHGGNWVDISLIVAELRKIEYEVYAFVTSREWNCMLKSQLAVPHVVTKMQGMDNIRKAYPFIFSHLEKARVPFILVSYEAILLNKHDYLKQTLEKFDLNYKKIDVVNQNQKFYEAE